MSKLTTLRETVSRWIAPTPPEPAKPLREAAGANAIDSDEDSWRRLSGDPSRDLSPLSQARMRKTAEYLWDGNPLANRIIELPLAYLLAEGVTLQAPAAPADASEAEKDAWAELQATLDDHWDHPINQWDIKLTKRLREFGLFGELALPAFVNDMDGSVTVGYLDPEHIATVVMDPDNPEQPVGIITVRRHTPDGTERRPLRYRVIINGDEELFTQRTQTLRATFTDGEIFYARCNELCASRRGRSDLRAMADFLDAYDDFIFGEVERYNFLRAFFWDVTLVGSDQTECDTKAKAAKPPRPGSVRFHNESETWAAVTPDLKASDTSAGAELVRNHVLGGATVPSHWYGGGGDVNRSTGESMGEPTFKIFSMRQRQAKHILESVGRYVLRKRLERLPGETVIAWNDPRLKVSAAFPEMTARDTTKYAAALQQVVTAVSSAIAQGLLSKATAVAIIAQVAGQLGIELDPDAELEIAGKEKSRVDEANTFTGPNAAAVKAAQQPPEPAAQP